MGLVTGLIILVYPASGPVAWLPGLGAGLAWYFLTPEDRVLRRIGFATGILLVASIPAVILVDVYLALGLLGPIYTLSALLSMNEAIRAFYQERGPPELNLSEEEAILFNPKRFAIATVLYLRGPQTMAELKKAVGL